MCSLPSPVAGRDRQKENTIFVSVMWGMKGRGTEIWLSLLRFPVVPGIRGYMVPKPGANIYTYTHTWGVMLDPSCQVR